MTRNSGTRGPALDIARWRQARELKRQGLSNLQVGLALDPPCGPNVVDRGLRRLARWEAVNVGAKGLDTAAQKQEG